MRAIKVSDEAHQRLKVIAAKRDEYVHAIVDDLLSRDRITALRHAVNRNHEHKPDVCSGCELAEQIIERDRKR